MEWSAVVEVLDWAYVVATDASGWLVPTASPLAEGPVPPPAHANPNMTTAAITAPTRPTRATRPQQETPDSDMSLNSRGQQSRQIVRNLRVTSRRSRSRSSAHRPQLPTLDAVLAGQRAAAPRTPRGHLCVSANVRAGDRRGSGVGVCYGNFGFRFVAARVTSIRSPSRCACRWRRAG